MSLRAEFPVLERIAYMNAGTDGPMPRRGLEAAAESLRAQAERGRAGKAHFEGVMEVRDVVRGHAARLMGCAPADVALTHSATDGMNLVLHGLRLGRGDEVVTTDEEHPGLLAPLGALARERGVRVRFAPFAEVANAVTASTRLVACSHVSWVNGQVADTDALRATGVPLLLDGAQGLGAIATRPAELGCAWYASAGQKWLCGPDQSGFLYVDPERVDELGAPWPGYQSLADAANAFESPLAEGAVRFDLGFPAPHDGAWALAAFELFEAEGWQAVHQAGTGLARRLATMLAERGHTVAPRGDTTLVAWEMPDPEAFVERAATNGVAVRHLPGRGLVRASVGAWNDESDLERLLALLA
ncbi:MAG: aminotransferase class V-fold PLP-dependent enzyme [Thermoleophilaceae bacterium]